tara:strand:+ start:9775 stop:10956 length:1182 start_codon:yes stop_codon:yes gene_type:complete
MKNNFNTSIDFGSSKIRLGITDKKNLNKNFYTEKDCISNLRIKDFNIIKSKEIVHDLIKKSEKEFGKHIDNINLMVDTPDIFSIDLSIKKKFEKKKINTEDISHSILEAKLLIQKNYKKKKILHIIIQKYNIDEIDYYYLPEDKIEGDNLILEIKFICFDNLIHDNLIENFKFNHIYINQICCSSYVKSLNYNNFFENYKKKVFLDIGFKKSTICVFYEDKLKFINNVPVGGDHITNDIAKIFKIKKENSENIKKKLNKSNSTFSDNSGEILNKKNLDKEVSLELLNKVIYARIDEILNLLFKDINLLNLIGNKKNSILIFTGQGSKILNKNSIYLKQEFDYFSEINFFEESTKLICESGLNFINSINDSEVNVIPKKVKKTGFFEKLFHLFD